LEKLEKKREIAPEILKIKPFSRLSETDYFGKERE